MKKLLYFIAIMAIIFSANCSRIEENNDPIIGIWYGPTEVAVSSAKSDIKQEWIFNDVYLGRYHEFQNGEIITLTDFKWSFKDDHYEVTYGKKDMPIHRFNIKESDNGQLLQTQEGFQLAAKE